MITGDMRLFTLLCAVVLCIQLQMLHATDDTCGLNLAGYSGSCMVASLAETGDVILGIMANHHTGSDGTWCERLRTSNVELTSLAMWVVDQFNQGDYISGIKLGVRVLDSCSREAMVPRALLSLVPGMETSPCSEESVAGILDLQNSDQSSTLAANLARGSRSLPVITATATAPSLSDRSQYPTFMRTIPSDNVAAQAIHDVIQNLKLKYVVIIYSNDRYGQEGNEILSRLLHQSNICTAANLEVQIGDASSVTQALAEVTAKLEKVGDSPAVLGVVHYGQHPTAKELLRQAARLPQGQGRQIIWFMSEAVGRETDLYTGHEDLARNVITITPAYHELTEFTQYWLNLLTVYLTDPSHPDPFLYRPYLESLLGCQFVPSDLSPCSALGRGDLERAYSQSGNAVVVVDAVVALAKALKDLQLQHCGQGSVGGCNAFMNAIHTQYQEALEEVEVYYPDLSLYVPAVLRDQARRVTFSTTTGNPDTNSNSPSHVIYKYSCSSSNDCHFRELATYQGGLRDWRLDGVNFYPYRDNDQPLAALDLPPIYCTSACSECVPAGVPFASIPGEFLLAALLPFHEPSQGAFLHCNTTAYRTRLIHSAETILYAIDLFNDPQGQFTDSPLHGRLGVVILDSCHSGVFSYQRIADLHSYKLKLQDTAGNLLDPDTIIAYIAGHYSSTQLTLTSVLEELRLVQLAYAATSTALNSAPHLLRTIPADDVQVLTIVEFVQYMGWNTLSILYQDDSYGQTAYSLMMEQAESRGLCVSLALPVPVFLDRDAVDRIIPRLYQTPDVEVVVLFTGFNATHTLLSVVNDRWQGKHFTWIGSEAWQTNAKFLEPTTRLEALGAITVLPRLPNFPDLKAYFTALTPQTNTRDPFFPSFWEHQFNCHLGNPSAAVLPSGLCPEELTLQGYDGFYDGAQLLMPAVLSAALGIGEALQIGHVCQGRIEICPAIRSDRGLQQIITYIKNVSLSLGSEPSKRVYTARGDGNIDYLVMNIQKVGEDYKYVQVAEFHPGSGFEPTANPVKFYTESEQKKSVGGSCSADCGACMPPPASSQATLGGVLGGVAVLLVVVIIISVILAYRRRGHCPAPATSKSHSGNGLIPLPSRRGTSDDLPCLPSDPERQNISSPTPSSITGSHYEDVRSGATKSCGQMYLTAPGVNYQHDQSDSGTYSPPSLSSGPLDISSISGRESQLDVQSSRSYEIPISKESPSSPSLIQSPLSTTLTKFPFPGRAGVANPAFHYDNSQGGYGSSHGNSPPPPVSPVCDETPTPGASSPSSVPMVVPGSLEQPAGQTLPENSDRAAHLKTIPEPLDLRNLSPQAMAQLAQELQCHSPELYDRYFQSEQTSPNSRI